MKIVETTRGLLSLSIRRGSKIVITVDLPQYAEVTYTKSHIKASLEKIGRKCGLQPEILKGESELSVIIKSNFANLKLLGAVS